jgi:hypothetical protein
VINLKQNLKKEEVQMNLKTIGKLFGLGVALALLALAGPDDIVYVTNVVFRDGKPERGGLTVYNPQGKWLAAGWGMHWRGVTVCAP